MVEYYPSDEAPDKETYEKVSSEWAPSAAIGRQCFESIHCLTCSDLLSLHHHFLHLDPTHKSAVKKIVGRTFTERVTGQHAPRATLLKMYSPSCGLCKTLAPKYNAFAAQVGGLQV
jgi:thiol-disulfide isomerase/thioredoxin